MGDLLGFKMVMILPNFQMLGIVFRSMEWLNMSVRALMATGHQQRRGGRAAEEMGGRVFFGEALCRLSYTVDWRSVISNLLFNLIFSIFSSNSQVQTL